MKGFGVPELVIVVGLLLVLIAGFLPSNTEQAQKEILLFSKQVGSLGPSDYTFKHVPLADELLLSKGVSGTPLLVQEGPIEVAKGIITSEEHSLSFDVSSQESVLSELTLTFEVVETNQFGPLRIYLNGEKIYEKLVSPGKVQVNLPLNMIKDGENNIKIVSGSSGWRIWSPSYYSLKNLQISEKFISQDEATLYFSVSSELIGEVDQGKVFVSDVSSELPGELAIILNNDKIVFQGVPGQGPFMSSFSSSFGENNSLTFKLVENGIYDLKNIEVVLFVKQEGSGGFSKEFKIPEKDLALMREGKEEGVIEVEVLNQQEKPLIITLDSERASELYNDVPPTGKLVLKFTGSEVSTDNILKISSASPYSLGVVSVKLVRK